jgi:hypothetical protein
MDVKFERGWHDMDVYSLDYDGKQYPATVYGGPRLNDGPLSLKDMKRLQVYENEDDLKNVYGSYKIGQIPEDTGWRERSDALKKRMTTSMMEEQKAKMGQMLADVNERAESKGLFSGVRNTFEQMLDR